MSLHRVRNTVTYRSQNFATAEAPFLSCTVAQTFVDSLAGNEYGPLAICAWEIRNDQLVLSYGEFWIDDGENHRRFVTMQEIFGTHRDILADWYSGTMVLDPIPSNGVLLILDFSHGKLVAERSSNVG